MQNEEYWRMYDRRQPDEVITPSLMPSRIRLPFTEEYLDLLTRYAREGQYDELSDLIIVGNDILEGVTSHIEKDSSRYPTGIAIVRDATETASAPKLPPDHPLIEANNMLLRTLSTMRGIDWVLEQKKNASNLLTEIQLALRKNLQIHVDQVLQFENAVMNGLPPDKSIRELETSFNQVLKQTLIVAELNGGINSDEDYKKLLLHYRNLASTLDPAKSVITKQKYGNIVHTEIAHPITQKTPEQLQQLQHMHSAEIAGENFHSVQKHALRIANACFYERIIRDDTRLPAQTRKTIGPTLKNGYIVCSDFDLDRDFVIATPLWTCRCATPVYVGKGADDDKRTDFAIENLRQLQAHVARHKHSHKDTRELSSESIKLHLTVLLTHSPGESQNIMIRCAKKAKDKLNSQQAETVFWSNVPTNAEGLIRALEISHRITELASEQGLDVPSCWTNITDKAERIRKAAQIITIAASSKDEISLIICASGQDRTGTAQEATTEFWLQRELKMNGIDMSLSEIQHSRALGFHNAFIATLAAPGSPGMKLDSKPGDFFSEDDIPHFYRKSADTNKLPPLDILPSAAELQAQDKLDAAYQGALYQINFGDPNDILKVIEAWREKAIAYQLSKDIPITGLFSFIKAAGQEVGRTASKGSKAIPRLKVNDLLMTLESCIQEHNLTQMYAEIGQIKEQYPAKARGTVINQLAELLYITQQRLPYSPALLESAERRTSSCRYGDL